MRLVTITVLSIIPIALMVLTATGYFYTTLRLSGRWIETVYLVIIWNLLYQTVLRGLSVAARRIAWRRALARRQNLVKEGAEGAEPPEEPTIALEQVNQQTLRITMLLRFAPHAFPSSWNDSRIAPEEQSRASMSPRLTSDAARDGSDNMVQR